MKHRNEIGTERQRCNTTLPARPILCPNFRFVRIDRCKLITVEGVTSIYLQKKQGLGCHTFRRMLKFPNIQILYNFKVLVHT